MFGFWASNLVFWVTVWASGFRVSGLRFGLKALREISGRYGSPLRWNPFMEL